MNDSLAFIHRRGSGINGGSGIVHCYKLSNEHWSEVQVLTVSDGNSGDHFGKSICLRDSIMALSALGDNTNANGSGAVYLFHYGSNGWTEADKLYPPDPQMNAYFGTFLGMSDNTIVVTSERHDFTFEDSGIAHVFSEVPVGIQNRFSSSSRVLVYPNPARNEFTLRIPEQFSGNLTVQICNAIGQIVLSDSRHSSKSFIYKEQLPNGLYFLTVSSENQSVSSKFVVNN
jgi:hypothetical protein